MFCVSKSTCRSSRLSLNAHLPHCFQQKSAWQVQYLRLAREKRFNHISFKTNLRFSQYIASISAHDLRSKHTKECMCRILNGLEHRHSWFFCSIRCGQGTCSLLQQSEPSEIAKQRGNIRDVTVQVCNRTNCTSKRASHMTQEARPTNAKNRPREAH